MVRKRLSRLTIYIMVSLLPHSLHLTNNLIRTAQALDHLLTLLASALGVVALLEQVVQLCCAVHLLQKFALHFVF